MDTINSNLSWIEFILLFFGVAVIIVAMFRPKEGSTFAEEKVEQLFDELLAQIDVENQEMINKIREAKQEVPREFLERLNAAEAKISKIEQETKSLREMKIELQEKENVQEDISHLNPKYNQVLKLYENGENIDSIAEKTEMGHAEIRLLLDLAKKGLHYV